MPEKKPSTKSKAVGKTRRAAPAQTANAGASKAAKKPAKSRSTSSGAQRAASKNGASASKIARKGSGAVKVPSAAPRRRATRKAHEYDIVLSFAGEDRDFVQRVNTQLQRGHVRTFYDSDHQAKLLAEDLLALLSHVYQYDARYCAMFISKHYIKKSWTKVERQAAQARAFESGEAYIIPVRLDDTVVPGVLSTTGYIDARDKPPREVVKLLKEKVSQARAADAAKIKRRTTRTSRTASTAAVGAGAKKRIKKSPSTIVPAPRSFTCSTKVSASGAWLLLNNEFHRDATVKTEAGLLIVEVQAHSADEEATFEALDRRHHPHQRHQAVSYAHGNKAHPVIVESVDHYSVKGKTNYILKLRPQNVATAGGMGLGFWIDDAAEKQARLLLLNDKGTAGASSGYFTQSFYGRGGAPQSGVFITLWRRLQGRRLSPTDVLRCARLEAMYHLKASDIVQHISELALGPASKGVLTVRLKAKRSGRFTGEEGIRIEFIGKCDLAAT